MNKDILSKAANEARGLAIDAVHACSSGHLGLPLGCAEIGAVLFSDKLNFNPIAPKWINRDRFILSAGHGSMFLYSWLHLAGYNLPIEEIKNFRQLGSHTPGHPEFGDTVGVEATTGPLGQGIANAVGYALSAKMSKATYNTADHTILDYHVFALAGDGCMQEGVAREAVAFAAHNKLDNLVLIYDSNEVTLDAMAFMTQSEDTEAVYKGLGWEVINVDGHDLDEVAKAIDTAKSNNNGQPKLIIAKTEIGKGIAEVVGTQKAHGEGGANFAVEAHKALGLPEETFTVSDEVQAHFSQRTGARIGKFAEWEKSYDAWAAANPELAERLSNSIAGAVPTNILDLIPEFADDYKGATRAAGGDIIQHVAKAIPQFITGSADLYGSTKNYIKDGGDWSPDAWTGRNIWFGIREHAMCAILNGIAYDGIWRASGATFAVFADYCRPSIRLAALAKLPVTYIFTHDSVGVGEDGPTHQPVETCSGLRVIPNLDVIRPGDPEETAGAYAAAMSRTDGPTMLLLSRQTVATQSQVPARDRRLGIEKGGYVLVKEAAELDTILIATGSELDLAVQAAKELGAGTRVVSMPCVERFNRQSSSYQQNILPETCKKRVAIEAGVSDIWWKYVGSEGAVVGIDRFGISAPGDVVLEKLGMSVENLVATAKSLG